MSLLSLVPNGVGAQTQHQRNIGSSNWSVMASDDGDSSYVYNQTSGGGLAQFAVDLYAMGNSGGELGIIDQVQVNLKARYRYLAAGGTAQAEPLLRLGKTIYSPGFSNLTGNYATYSYTRTTHPGTGLPFTWADIDGHQAGLNSVAGDAGVGFTEVRATCVWTVVTFHMVLRPGAPAAVGVVSQQPELRLSVRLGPDAPAGVGVVSQQPALRLHLLLTPEGTAVVPVTAEDAALLIGAAPGRDPRAVFDLQLRGTGELAMSLRQAHTLLLDLKRTGVIEEES